MGLLLLRVVIGATAVVQGAIYISEPARSGLINWVVGLLEMLSGVSLLAGFLTPFAVVLVGITILGKALSWFPQTATAFLESTSSALLALTMAIAVALLGPGRFSLDSRLFGRREIIIPPATRTSGSDS